MGVSGTAVAPHGLILGEDEATPSRKLFKHLPGQIKKNKKNKKYKFFVINSRSTGPGGCYVLREFVNYRHPGPRRVWKVGSELQSTTSLPALRSLRYLCSKVVLRLRETALYQVGTNKI